VMDDHVLLSRGVWLAKNDFGSVLQRKLRFSVWFYNINCGFFSSGLAFSTVHCLMCMQSQYFQLTVFFSVCLFHFDVPLQTMIVCCSTACDAAAARSVH